MIRLDADVAKVDEALRRFDAAPAGVLVGTQMVAKGHDFPDVTLGVVVDADSTLRFPDFRAEERTFALVAQLAGRSGRGSRGGKVIVHFEVTAPGVPEPDGTVVIKVGDRERTVAVKKGKAIARIVGMPPGRYRVRCQYAGGTYVIEGKARDWVRVPGKGPRAKG